MKSLIEHPHFTKSLMICDKLNSNGFKAWYAGGCVRDGIINRAPKDLDIVTDAKPEVVEGLFEKTLSIGKQFGIIVVIIEDTPFEVATFRKDGEYKDGRHPESIEYSDDKEDSNRRDFTINSMFYDPINKKTIDHNNGLEDLSKKQIRCVGDSFQRFNEDKLRILRAIRFQSELGYSIETQTEMAISSFREELFTVSAERIRIEIDKTLNGDFLEYAMQTLNRTKLSQVIVNAYFEKTSEWTKSQSILVKQIFFYSVELNKMDQTVELMRNMKYSSQTLKDISWLLSKLNVQNPKRAELCKIASHSRSRELVEFLSLSKKTNYLNDLKKLTEQGYQLPEPFIDGRTLLTLGFKQGPQLGEFLSSLYDLQLSEEIQSKEQAIQYCINVKQ